jgi:hypothetical protein
VAAATAARGELPKRVTSCSKKWRSVYCSWNGRGDGVLLVLGETRRNWGAWGHWASYTFDGILDFAALSGLLMSAYSLMRPAKPNETTAASGR